MAAMSAIRHCPELKEYYQRKREDDECSKAIHHTACCISFLSTLIHPKVINYHSCQRGFHF